MTHGDIEEKIVEILANKLNVDKDKISGDSRLRDDLGIDSFSFVEIMFEFEDAFAMKIPDEDIEAVKTVREVVEYIEDRTAQK